MAQHKKRKCQRCNEMFEEGDMYDIETPNYRFELCLDCSLEIEKTLKDAGNLEIIKFQGGKK